jgi:hypothetical protein
VFIVAESRIAGRAFYTSFMLSFTVLTFLLILPYSQSNIYSKEMNDYVDMAMGILNDSSEHDPTGKFIHLSIEE